MPKPQSKSTKQEREILPFASQALWQRWLAKHHETSPGVWLKLAKKDSGLASVTYAEALDVALCYGWIDAQKKSFDDQHWLQLFMMRRPRSKWSKVNCGKVATLIATGRMTPAGLRHIEAAKADGRWEVAYDAPSTAMVPSDLETALAQNPTAKAFFGTLTSQNRYAILYRIQDAKLPATRVKRIEKLVAMLSAKETIHPQKRSASKGDA